MGLVKRPRGYREIQLGKRTETMSTETTSPKEQRRVLGYLYLDKDGQPAQFFEASEKDPPFWYWSKDSSTPSECGEHLAQPLVGANLPPKGEHWKDRYLRQQEEMNLTANQLNDAVDNFVNPIPMHKSPVCLESLPFGAVQNFLKSLGHYVSVAPEFLTARLQDWYSSLTETQKEKLVEFIGTFESDQSTAST